MKKTHALGRRVIKIETVDNDLVKVTSPKGYERTLPMKKALRYCERLDKASRYK